MARPKTANRKRRGRGEGGVSFREDQQLWVGSVSLGYHADGRRNRPVVYGETKQAVLDELARLRARAGLRAADPGELTVGELVSRWLATKQGSTAPRTHEERELVVNAQLIPRLGSARLSSLTPLHVEGFYLGMARDGVGRTTARHAAKVLVAALRHAVGLRLLQSSPADGVALPSVPRREMLCLTQMQAQALLLAADGWSISPLIALALGSGCRQGELLGLTWADLDLVAGTLTVRRALTFTRAAGFALKEPKTLASRRTVSLPSFAVEALLAHRAAQLRAGLARAPVFCTRKGTFLSRGAVTRAFRAIIQLANDPASRRRPGRPRKDALPLVSQRRDVLPDGLRFHDLRHSVASLLLSAGQSLRAVSQRLGHADPALTLRLYTHCLPGDDEQLSAALERLIG